MNQTLTSVATMELHSSAFSNGETIPIKYSGQGDNLSPPLAWSGAPTETRSLALIVEDPDAPMITFTHWLLYNVPPSVTGLPEGIARDMQLPDGSRQGKNTAQSIGYTGPMPPTKKPHRYFFKLYALDAMLELDAGASKSELLEAIKGHEIAEGQLMGIYQKH